MSFYFDLISLNMEKQDFKDINKNIDDFNDKASKFVDFLYENLHQLSVTLVTKSLIPNTFSRKKESFKEIFDLFGEPDIITDCHLKLINSGEEYLVINPLSRDVYSSLILDTVEFDKNLETQLILIKNMIQENRKDDAQVEYEKFCLDFGKRIEIAFSSTNKEL